MGGHQRNQGLEVLGGTAFADEDLHAEADLLQGARQTEALVIGGDARAYILLQVGSSHRRRMAVDGLTVLAGSSDFLQKLGVVVDDTRIVHHLREIVNVGRSHQLLDIGSIQHTT